MDVPYVSWRRNNRQDRPITHGRGLVQPLLAGANIRTSDHQLTRSSGNHRL
ncbi:hypothetical protein LZ31DRAFT_555743, partial [Colletotrichum somersetense]